MPAPPSYTAEMVRALPDDGKRYETVYGELLVTPAPRLLHQLVLSRLMVRLDSYLSREHDGVLLPSPADISWGPDILVQPDLFVAASGEVRTMEWKHVRTLLLAIEILSPSSVKADRLTKRRLYQEQRIPLYWIVDCDAATVEAWTPDAVFPVVEKETAVWQPAGAAVPCIIELAEIFAPL